MSLVRDLYRSWREERKRPTANAKKQIEFEEWMQNVTSGKLTLTHMLGERDRVQTTYGSSFSPHSQKVTRTCTHRLSNALRFSILTRLWLILPNLLREK